MDSSIGFIAIVVFIAVVAGITVVSFVSGFRAKREEDAALDPGLMRIPPLHPGPCRRWFAYVAQGEFRGQSGMLELSGGQLAWLDFSTRAPRWSVPVAQLAACWRPTVVKAISTPHDELAISRLADICIMAGPMGEYGLIVSLTKPKGRFYTNLDALDENRSAHDLMATLRAVGVGDYTCSLPMP